MDKEMSFSIKKLPAPYNFYRFITGSDYLHFGYWPDDEIENVEEIIAAQKKLSDITTSFIPKQAGRVLDVGCGLGQTAIELAQGGNKVVGISPDQELIKYSGMLAKKKIPSNTSITFKKSSFEEYTDKDIFDCLLFQESLQYLQDLRRVFKKAVELVKNDGVIVICDKVRYQERLDEPTSAHLKTDILNCAEDAGLELKDNISISSQVFKTFDFVIGQFVNRRAEVLEEFRNIPGIETTFEKLLNDWKRDKRWFEEGKYGYEIFVFGQEARHNIADEFTIHSYSEGDEEEILSLFNLVFSQKRTREHWLWKFRNSPFGKHKIKLCWYGKRLVAQYAGYPVTMEWNGKKINVFHLGDSMTDPDFRNIIMGRNGLFVRTANNFFDEFGGTEVDKAQIMYGFNTGKVQKLGRLLLRYTPVSKVTQLGKLMDSKKGEESIYISNFLYSIQSTLTVPEDIDALRMKCRPGQELETIRDYKYLKWRYEDCPDTEYTFWTLRNRFTKAIQGIMITRERAGIGCIVDFLWRRNGRGIRLSLKQIEEHFLKLGIKKSELWISEYHFLFPLLRKYGYRLEKEPNDLSVICRSFTPTIDVNTLKTKYFYTMGDSDLF